MRKIVLSLLSVFLLVGTTSAQTGKKALKKAGKEINKYSSDPVNAAESLEAGLALLNTAFEDAEVAANPDSYIMKGKMYNDIIGGEWKNSLINPEVTMNSVDAPYLSAESYVKALELASKKSQTKAALAGLADTEAYLNNVGVMFFEDQDYGTAFNYFNKAIEIYKVINENGGKSRLDEEAIRNEHYYITAASGYYGDKKQEAKPLLIDMYNQNSDKALVYEALFNISSEEGSADAEAYLAKGRELFPEDNGLLFAEINYFLKEGRLDELTGKLKKAIEKEPENASIYITLGSVYDQLNQKEREAGNTEKATEYFDLAMDYYNQTLERDPDNFDAMYSQGALYYNRAAAMTDEINELANDFSPAGTKKYNELKAEMDTQFSKALPYFENADKAASAKGETDLNTLVALKEIYARTNQLDKVGPLKARIEALQGN